MQIRELSKPITAEMLNESLAKKFGYKLNLEQFSDVQLEDARNKLRTKLSQFEVSESFDSVNESPDYQKTRIMLDCINQEIMERDEGKCSECHKDPCVCTEEEEDNTPKAKKVKKESKDIYANAIRQKARAASVPQSWIESAINRINLGEADQEELASELTTRYDLSESTAEYIVYLAEGEEDKASIIMSTKDMVDKITGWLEDTAQLKAEHLLELMDSIRENLGNDVAAKYEQAVKPALESIYTALETSRQGMQSALAVVSGGEAPMMGTDTSLPPLPGSEETGMEEPTDVIPELPAPEGEEGVSGREKRESIDYSRRLGILLAASKKK
jgi:hypothetical protein